MGAKNAVQKARRLYLLDPKLSYGLETDASTIGLGARLYQFDEENINDKKHNIAFASRSLKPAEKNYTITELEGLALAWALKKFRLILEGRRVHVSTDHSALRFMSSCAQKARESQDGWSFMLYTT